jgi:hypothetical protein
MSRTYKCGTLTRANDVRHGLEREHGGNRDLQARGDSSGRCNRTEDDGHDGPNQAKNSAHYRSKDDDQPTAPYHPKPVDLGNVAKW